MEKKDFSSVTLYTLKESQRLTPFELNTYQVSILPKFCIWDEAHSFDQDHNTNATTAVK